MTFELRQFKWKKTHKYGRRKHPKPFDCVINSLEAIDVIDNQIADIMRIILRGPLQKGEIEEIFKTMMPESEWQLMYLSSGDFSNIVTSTVFEPNHLIVCGYKNPHTSDAHVFTIFKDNNNDIILIDPHQRSSWINLSREQNNLLPSDFEYYIMTEQNIMNRLHM